MILHLNNNQFNTMYCNCPVFSGKLYQVLLSLYNLIVIVSGLEQNIPLNIMLRNQLKKEIDLIWQLLKAVLQNTSFAGISGQINSMYKSFELAWQIMSFNLDVNLIMKNYQQNTIMVWSVL